MDFYGRPRVVITLPNANSVMHNRDFKVTYRVEAKSMLVKPFLLATVAFGFLLIFIMSFRVDLAINRARGGLRKRSKTE